MAPLAVAALVSGCASERPSAPLSPEAQARIDSASATYHRFATDVDAGRFGDAALLFTDDARMRNHALMSATGPGEIEGMLQKLAGREWFETESTGKVVGDSVVLNGRCYRSIARNSVESQSRYEVVLKPSGDRWLIASVDTYDVAHATSEAPVLPILAGDVVAAHNN